MLYLASTIKDLNIQASDGELGGVKDLYFDDKFWTIRYLVTDTRKWLPGKKVLLSPLSFDEVDIKNGKVNVLSTKDTVKNAPHQHEDKPVSKQVELDLAIYYGWPTYWSGAGPWSGYNDPYTLADSHSRGLVKDRMEMSDNGDQHLRSVNEIKGDFFGYRISAIDGEIGHVSNFIIDDNSWEITYLVVETKNILTGKFRLIAPKWINQIDWVEHRVFVDLTKEQVKQGADYDPSQSVPQDLEDRILQGYRK
ncbi:PRC-barrel domain-containing protein [Aquibacillus koreensis]|uniref:PRC-barrel domain-containing protein n=1 Tax=Aquibacillus koreensis TaxID=279446 RepID=UPI0021A70395|nr:PRC-barrel domain-containing protein [Aquibacillus koreensis]MCT2537673.1 PRC-barrel domain-containing protein [Aquibacillus koreensis]